MHVWRRLRATALDVPYIAHRPLAIIRSRRGNAWSCIVIAARSSCTCPCHHMPMGRVSSKAPSDAANVFAFGAKGARGGIGAAGPAIEPEANRVVLVGGCYSTHKLPGHGRGGFVLALVLAALVACVLPFPFAFACSSPLPFPAFFLAGSGTSSTASCRDAASTVKLSDRCCVKMTSSNNVGQSPHAL